MTFRFRFIITTVLAVTIAVIFACLSSYVATRNAVQRSVDDSLRSAARANPTTGQNEVVAGVFYQVVFPNGRAYPSSNLPIDSAIIRVADLKVGFLLRTIDVGGASYRELALPLLAGTILHCEEGPCQLPTNAAQVFSVNVSGQQHQLHVLAVRLLLLAIGGVGLAVLLGLLAARAALGPLENVTNEIETVAETSDISHRLEEGRNDELGRLRRVFNDLLESVDLSQRTQRQLVLDASHELRTPLTSLRTNAQVLSRADRLGPEEVSQITGDMIAQVDELNALIGDLTELARGEEIDAPTERLRLDELIDECCEMGQIHGRARNVTIESDLDPCTVEGHRDRLVRATNNLISNAIKFARDGGRVRVTLHANDAAEIVVEDDGPGVADEDIPFVFDRFWRSSRARSQPGSGLGLAIVAQVANEMGGTVDVGRSTELGGARFTLRLPIASRDDS